MLRVVVRSTCTHHQPPFMGTLGSSKLRYFDVNFFVWTLLPTNKNRSQNYLVMRPWKLGLFFVWTRPAMQYNNVHGNGEQTD
jgi:hypothetical protein